MGGRSLDPAAFDAFASEYDTDFTNSILGRLLRPRVWKALGQYFQPGQNILELACGTGEDALWLAHRGVTVTATDGSAEMIRVTQAKAEAAGIADRIVVRQLSLQQLIGGDAVFAYDPMPQFDGVFSNFGGLNTIGAWQPLAESLAKLVKPGGWAILVPMGPFCPWEIGWYVGHGQIRTGLRRFNQPSEAKIGETVIPIWYPSVRRLRADFAPWFEPKKTESLGLWLPPSYLDYLANRWPGLFDRLNRFESTTAHLSQGWGDHYISLFQRRG